HYRGFRPPERTLASIRDDLAAERDARANGARSSRKLDGDSDRLSSSSSHRQREEIDHEDATGALAAAAEAAAKEGQVEGVRLLVELLSATPLAIQREVRAPSLGNKETTPTESPSGAGKPAEPLWQ